jgi:hypothetical protein
MVFHSPHAGHLPIHFGLSFPHALQNHTLFVFAAAIYSAFEGQVDELSQAAHSAAVQHDDFAESHEPQHPAASFSELLQHAHEAAANIAATIAIAIKIFFIIIKS